MFLIQYYYYLIFFPAILPYFSISETRADTEKLITYLKSA